MPHGVNEKVKEDSDEDGDVDYKALANKKLNRLSADDNFDLDLQDKAARKKARDEIGRASCRERVLPTV